jgi:hypothetical protein
MNVFLVLYKYIQAYSMSQNNYIYTMDHMCMCV